MTVPPILVRRLKSHFISLPCGVDLILGLNGYIWVSKHVKDNDQGEEGFDAEAVYSNQNDVGEMSLTLSVVHAHTILRTSTMLLVLQSHASVISFVFLRTISFLSQTHFYWRPMNGLSSKKEMLHNSYWVMQAMRSSLP